MAWKLRMSRTGFLSFRERAFVLCKVLLSLFRCMTKPKSKVPRKMMVCAPNLFVKVMSKPWILYSTVKDNFLNTIKLFICPAIRLRLMRSDHILAHIMSIFLWNYCKLLSKNDGIVSVSFFKAIFNRQGKQNGINEIPFFLPRYYNTRVDSISSIQFKYESWEK